MNHRQDIERLIAEQKPGEAAACWELMPTDAPGYIDAARRITQELLAAGDGETADAVLAQLAANRPNLVWMLQLRAQLAAKRSDPTARLGHLRRLFELQPESPAAAAGLMSSLLESGDMAAAEAASREHAAHVCYAMPRLARWVEPVRSAELEPTSRARQLYLDLLERTVSNWIYGDPWNRLGELRPFEPDRRVLGQDIPSLGHTMIGLTRLRHLRVLTEHVLRENVPGDLVEAGVWRGGACILMAGVLEAHGDTLRKVVAADSFAGLPPPDPRYPKDALTTFDFHLREELSVSADTVKSNFERYGLWSERVTLLEGLFCDTLPSYPNRPIALLRMDGDLYSSTMDTLVHLYDRVSPGGFVISDDYGVVIDARRAVLDFRATRAITAEMFRVDGDAVFWRKD